MSDYPRASTGLRAEPQLDPPDDPIEDEPVAFDMPVEQQRQFIANALNYEYGCVMPVTGNLWVRRMAGISGNPEPGNWHGRTDFLTDYNAMHEAEDTLTDSEHQRFRNILGDMSGSDYPYTRERFMVSDATCAQRAEAFIRCKEEI